MNPIFEFYKVALFLTDALPLIAFLCLPKSIKEQVPTLLLSWLLIRLMANGFCEVADRLQLPTYPVFHVSVFIEFTLLTLYFIQLKQLKSIWRKVLLSIPILVFLTELCFINSLFALNEFSILVSSFLTTLLFLSLLFDQKTLNENQVKTATALFLFHTVTFIFSLLQREIRINMATMQLIYPFFLLSYVSISVYFTYQFWILRKSGEGKMAIKGN
jgi:hypothetical protein